MCIRAKLCVCVCYSKTIVQLKKSGPHDPGSANAEGVGGVHCLLYPVDWLREYHLYYIS